MKVIKVIQSADTKINLCALLSLLIVVLHDLWWSSLPEVFPGGALLMTSLYNLMMGYLVSYIFFILVVQYQDYKNKIHVSTVIKPPLESIVTSIREVNSVFSQASGKQGFNGLSESQNKEVMSSINSNDIVERVPETFLFGASSWATYLNYHKKSVLRNIKKIEPYLPHIEPELIAIINGMSSSNLYLVLHFLVEENDEELSVLAKYYAEYSSLGKSLFEYTKKLP